jgi:dienelactone hydrolase
MAGLSAYSRFEFRYGSWTRDVYRRGAGPAVIVVHEAPNIHELVIRFADRVAAAGHTVFLPSLTGTPEHAVTKGYVLGVMLKVICVQREFNFWSAGKSSPIVDWLRALARQVHGECGGRGVGAVGMCLTGGFALAMMTDPSVIAPVLSQPSMPAPINARNKASIDTSPEEIGIVKARLEKEDLSILALRFDGDPAVPRERFDYLRSCFGTRCETIELNAADAARNPLGGAPHSVLTAGIREDDPSGPTKRTEERVIRFLRDRLHSQPHGKL